mgnify:CR=1 FL=1
MDQEALKRVKRQKKHPTKMFLDSEAVALSVIPFLNAVDLKKYMAINVRMHHTYDNDEIWRKVAQQFFSGNHWLNYTGIEIKKCIHFHQLTRKYTLRSLMDEVTNESQLRLLILYVNKTLNYTANAKHVMRIMIGFLAPYFLRHVFIRYPYFPYRDHLPPGYYHLVKYMEETRMFDLGDCIDANPYPLRGFDY